MEKYNEKSVLISGVIALAILFAIGWFLFSDHRAERDNIGAGFQQTQDSIGRVQDSLDRSQDTVGRIERGIDDSERTANAIGDGIERAYESACRIESASAEIERAVGTAIEGNHAAQTAVERSIERLDESQSILAGYKSGS